ncbi:MAG: hypothetical protein FVQ77_00475 [Cytophagales bacterium]|nr:hypothetical protein [Cytophagales bacterium]
MFNFLFIISGGTDKLLLITFLFEFVGLQNVNFVTVKITDYIKVSLPEEFLPMTFDDLVVKYPSPKKPTAMYTNPDRLVDFGLNETSNNWPANDLELLKNLYRSSILNLYDTVFFIQQVVQKINKREFIVLEFVSGSEGISIRGKLAPLIGTYSYIQYTVYNDKILVFNFSCPAFFKKEWEQSAKMIMNSIKIK